MSYADGVNVFTTALLFHNNLASPEGCQLLCRAIDGDLQGGAQNLQSKRMAHQNYS